MIEVSQSHRSLGTLPGQPHPCPDEMARRRRIRNKRRPPVDDEPTVHEEGVSGEQREPEHELRIGGQLIHQIQSLIDARPQRQLGQVEMSKYIDNSHRSEYIGQSDLWWRSMTPVR